MCWRKLCPVRDSRMMLLGVQPKASDPSENARSLGVVIEFGKLRIVDLGDLTWNKELG